MTSVEAIEILKERRMCAAYVDSEYVDRVDIEAINMAISALEKQAQEKPRTYADKYFRQATDEKLANKLYSIHINNFPFLGQWTVEQWLNWLKQEVSDNG